MNNIKKRQKQKKLRAKAKEEITKTHTVVWGIWKKVTKKRHRYIKKNEREGNQRQRKRERKT